MSMRILASIRNTCVTTIFRDSDERVASDQYARRKSTVNTCGLWHKVLPPTYR